MEREGKRKKSVLSFLSLYVNDLFFLPPLFVSLFWRVSLIPFPLSLVLSAVQVVIHIVLSSILAVKDKWGVGGWGKQKNAKRKQNLYRLLYRALCSEIRVFFLFTILLSRSYPLFVFFQRLPSLFGPLMGVCKKNELPADPILTRLLRRPVCSIVLQFMGEI